MSRVGEYSDEAGMRIVTRTKRVLYDSPSEINGRVIVIDTDTFGRSLLIGHRLAFQTTERLDIYDETLGHITLNEHPSPKRVAIIGGGDGKIAEIALKHGAEEVYVLEIDEKVIEAARTFTSVFEDERVKVLIGDAFESVDSLPEGYFDVIVGDYSDPYPDEPAKSLLGDEFIRKIKKILKPDGIVSLQAGSPIFQRRLTKRVLASLRKSFENVRLFRSPMPVYPGAFRTYAIASDREFSGPYRKIEGEFYNVEIHKAAFVLPTFIREIAEL